jgi:DNA polymerase-3 subunit delta'
LWLTTKKQYLLDDLLPLQEKLQFSLGEHEQFFFIIELADLLSPLSANALLKSLEEPPLGYHFILLAKEITHILPTIVSRCVVFYMQETAHFIQCKTLYDHFTQEALAPSIFLRELDRLKITEEQTEELLKQIIQFWQKESVTASVLSKEKSKDVHLIEKKLNHFYNAIAFLPKSGNAKLFWKKLLLQFDQFIL